MKEFIPLNYAEKVIYEAFKQFDELSIKRLHDRVYYTSIIGKKPYKTSYELYPSNLINKELKIKGDYFDYEMLIPYDKPNWFNSSQIDIKFIIHKETLTLYCNPKYTESTPIKIWNILKKCVKLDNMIHMNTLNDLIDYMCYKSLSNVNNYQIVVNVPTKLQKKSHQYKNVKVCLNEFIKKKPHSYILDVYAICYTDHIEICVNNKLAKFLLDKTLRVISFNNSVTYIFDIDDWSELYDIPSSYLGEFDSEACVNLFNKVFDNQRDPIFKKVKCVVKSKPLRLEMTPIK